MLFLKKKHLVRLPYVMLPYAAEVLSYIFMSQAAENGCRSMLVNCDPKHSLRQIHRWSASSKINRSLSSQPRQGSVMDLPNTPSPIF